VLGRHRHLLGDQAVLDPALLVLQHPQTRASLAALSELADADPIVLVACAWLGEDECTTCLCFDSLLSLLFGLGLRVHTNADVVIRSVGLLFARSKTRYRVDFGLPSSWTKVVLAAYCIAVALSMTCPDPEGSVSLSFGLMVQRPPWTCDRVSERILLASSQSCSELSEMGLTLVESGTCAMQRDWLGKLKSSWTTIMTRQ